MRRLPCLWLTLFAAASTGAESKPNFTGVWKLTRAEHPQAIIISQNESELRVFQFVEDRLVALRGPIDGQPHSQTVDDRPYEFRARWEGDSLFYEINPGGKQLMHLDRDGKTMSVTSTGNEKWERQDPLPREDMLTPFEARAKLDDPSADLSGVEGNRLRGWMAHAFNDVPQAERQLLPIINQKPASKFRGEARCRLADVYRRNGMVRKALSYWGFAERLFFYQRLAKYPEMSVTHRGYARFHATRDSGGRSVLPVTIAGKDAAYEVDTGANASLLSLSEAKRLGLKLEPLHETLLNGIIKFEAPLTIVPALTVGETRLENVPFWVVPDARMDNPGVLGIDILLKLETLRWNPDGDVETGFPAQEKDIPTANLCFWDDDLLTDVLTQTQGKLIFFLDMGADRTELYPRFAIANLDLLSVKGKRSSETIDAFGGHRDFIELEMPEVEIGVGGAVVAKHPAGVLLEKPQLHPKIHGVIGMDSLNAGARVTLDLQAMRLSIEPPLP